MPSPTLLIIGAGHVGRAVAELSGWLGLDTVVWDDRAELGAALAATVLGNPKLKAQWMSELKEMSDRIVKMRSALRKRLE